MLTERILQSAGSHQDAAVMDSSSRERSIPSRLMKRVDLDSAGDGADENDASAGNPVWWRQTPPFGKLSFPSATSIEDGGSFRVLPASAPTTEEVTALSSLISRLLGCSGLLS